MHSPISREKRKERLKKNKEYLLRQKELAKLYRKKYFKKNKQKIYDRENKYRKEMRETAKEIGTCSRCFKEKENIKFKMCAMCREYFRGYYGKKEI